MSSKLDQSSNTASVEFFVCANQPGPIHTYKQIIGCTTVQLTTEHQFPQIIQNFLTMIQNLGSLVITMQAV